MDVILLSKDSTRGNLGDQITVAAGYARNYLFPRGKAVPATPQNRAMFEAKRAEIEAKELVQLQAAQQRAEKLGNIVVSIAAKAGDEGKLFGSIGTRDIADAITAAGITVEKSEVRLPSGQLRQAGQHEIALQLHSEVTAVVKINIVPEA